MHSIASVSYTHLYRLQGSPPTASSAERVAVGKDEQENRRITSFLAGIKDAIFLGLLFISAELQISMPTYLAF